MNALLPRLYSAQADVSASPLTVFCDFDGPILDVSDRYYSTYQLGLTDTQAFYQDQGITLPLQVLTKTQFWQMKQDRVPDTEIAMRSGLCGEQIEIFLARVTQIVNQPALLQQDFIQPGVKWALTLLRSQGVQLVLVTLRCQAQVVQILQEQDLLNLFSYICGTQDQHAAYLNYADLKTQLLGTVLAEPLFRNVKPESAWMIGDTEADILAGQAWGIPTIALTCGIRSRLYLQKFQPTQILSDLASAAHYLLHSPVLPAKSR